MRLQHPFHIGMRLWLYTDPYMAYVRLHDVVEDEESASVILLWRWEDFLQVRPLLESRKAWYGCHILLGEAVVMFQTLDRLSLLLSRPKAVVWVEGRRYYSLDYPIPPEAAFDKKAMLATLRMHAAAERELLKTMHVPTGPVLLPGENAK